MQEVLRNLVKRYVAAMIRDAKTEEGLTEENFKVSIEKWFSLVKHLLLFHWLVFVFLNNGYNSGLVLYTDT